MHRPPSNTSARYGNHTLEINNASCIIHGAAMSATYAPHRKPVMVLQATQEPSSANQAEVLRGLRQKSSLPPSSVAARRSKKAAASCSNPSKAQNSVPGSALSGTHVGAMFNVVMLSANCTRRKSSTWILMESVKPTFLGTCIEFREAELRLV